MLLNFYLELDLLITRMLTLQLNLMCIWLPREGNHYLIPLFTNNWLATKFISLLLVQTFPMLFTRWASICLLHNRLTMQLFCAFFDTWRALSFMAFSTLLSIFSFSVHSLMLIGQVILLIEGQPLVIAFFLVLLWFLGEARNKLLWLAPVLKQNIVPLLIPHLSSFCFNGFLRI